MPDDMAEGSKSTATEDKSNKQLVKSRHEKDLEPKRLRKEKQLEAVFTLG